MAHPLRVEFIYMIEGALSVRVEEAEHSLAAGDSMYFDSSVSHAYRRSGSRRCRAIVVTSDAPTGLDREATPR